jgi:hypothetical protein
MRWKHLGFMLLGSTLFVGQALAGPPLLCQQYEIGSAPSLPWGKDPKGPLADYPRDRLVEDTLRLLAPTAPVLARMETLRRATYYLEGRADVAGELLARLGARALDAESLGKSDALAWFDAGYLAASLEQAEQMKGWPRVAAGIDGYRWVRQAIRLRKQMDPAMEFAAALINNERPGRPGQHWTLAASGAKTDSLLGKNLALYQKF